MLIIRKQRSALHLLNLEKCKAFVTFWLKSQIAVLLSANPSSTVLESRKTFINQRRRKLVLASEGQTDDHQSSRLPGSLTVQQKAKRSDARCFNVAVSVEVKGKEKTKISDVSTKVCCVCTFWSVFTLFMFAFVLNIFIYMYMCVCHICIYVTHIYTRHIVCKYTHTHHIVYKAFLPQSRQSLNTCPQDTYAHFLFLKPYYGKFSLEICAHL